jgi:hypothetical protein
VGVCHVTNPILSATLTPDITVKGQIGLSLNKGDGARLYVNNQLVLDNWSNTSFTSANFAFTANTAYSIRVEYASRQNMNYIMLNWNLVGPTGIQAAVQAAKQCEVAIVVVGEDVNTCGEGKDRSTLDLPGIGDGSFADNDRKSTVVGATSSGHWHSNNCNSAEWKTPVSSLDQVQRECNH